MSYDVLRQQFTREHIWLVEIIQGANTWRFCENRSPMPVGLDAVPSIKSLSINPTAVDLSGGLGVRASCSIAFADHLDYTSTPVRFWPRWRAQNPYYQGARVRVLSCYIDGNTYSESNAQAREYVLETWTYSRGTASITCKDPLKLADNNRAQAPRKTTRTLTVAVDAVTATLTVNDTAGWAVNNYLRIGAEVAQITAINSATSITVTRGVYNTAAEAHAADDAVQLCIYYNDTLNNIIEDLLVNYAGVDVQYIPAEAWADEVSLWLPGLYETLITEPVGVQALLKELADSAPHYLFWDERTAKIQLAAVKQPSSTSPILTDDNNLIEGSVAFRDKNDMRVSRVVVNFGQLDPTRKLDEFSNYRQAFVRVDVDAETNYGTPRIKTVNSRWINNVNKAAAVRLAARIGRRFSLAPRECSFELDPKDGQIWTGDAVRLLSGDLVDNAGAPVLTDFQVVSAVEKQVYEYTALEHTYGPAVPEDADADQPGNVVILSGELTDINLRTIYDSLFPTINATDEVIFIFDGACVAGGTTTGAAVTTGTWAELNTPPLLDVRGLIVGKGGDGGAFNRLATDGGLALNLDNDVRISNTGVIGGGGGGGSDSLELEFTNTHCGGGGGAGFVIGTGGEGVNPAVPGDQAVNGVNGTYTAGGAGGASGVNFGGIGGNLGQPGTVGESTTSPAGAAGAAINRNGYTITYVNAGAGDIRGAIL